MKYPQSMCIEKCKRVLGSASTWMRVQFWFDIVFLIIIWFSFFVGIIWVLVMSKFLFDTSRVKSSLVFLFLRSLGSIYTVTTIISTSIVPLFLLYPQTLENGDSHFNSHTPHCHISFLYITSFDINPRTPLATRNVICSVTYDWNYATLQLTSLHVSFFFTDRDRIGCLDITKWVKEILGEKSHY